jgi:hypothetical protein
VQLDACKLGPIEHSQSSLITGKDFGSWYPKRLVNSPLKEDGASLLICKILPLTQSTQIQIDPWSKIAPPALQSDLPLHYPAFGHY